MENVLMVLDMAMAVMGLGCILGDVIVILKKLSKEEDKGISPLFYASLKFLGLSCRFT